MTCISKIKLTNFKRFETFEVEFDDKLNLLIGDNESGKSSILTAIDLTISGSRNKVESIGLEYLFNIMAIDSFLLSDKKYENLPILVVELFLNEQNNEETNGRINSDRIQTDGLKFTCKPNDEFSSEIKKILQQPNCIFPFEFYAIEFKTFSEQTYSGFNKHAKHILIDNAQTSSEYAMKEYVKDMYFAILKNVSEKHTNQHQYRIHKENFKTNALNDFNKRTGDYHFAIKSNSKSNLETDLTIYEGKISIDNKGKGKQCMIKTQLALNRSDIDLDIVLIEEPENHLSHSSMKELINKISSSSNKQIFISTHSDLISTRLDLRKSILLNSSSTDPIKLDNLKEDTAKFFIKAPDNNILEFIMSKKVILVEGDAEFILADTLFKNAINESLADHQIHVISVDGTSFKQYLELAKILKIRTAVVRDNDKNYQENCVENYSEYKCDNISIFADTDISRYTFEKCIYDDNKDICETLFSEGRRTLNVLQYMLQNKAEVAYTLLVKNGDELKTPQYITEAFQWIKK